MENTLKSLYKEAYAHNRNKCGMIEKSFDIKDWVSLIFGEAQMFCLRHKFPSLPMWSELDKKFDIARYEIYVNKGKITLAPQKEVILIGDTEATLTYSKLRAYHVVVMHGATVNVKASGRAVVFMRAEDNCTINEDLTEGAIIQRQ
jgi:hypothetical protein